jgi:hypothetical protein
MSDGKKTDCGMVLTVAGKNRSRDIGRDIAAEAAAFDNAEFRVKTADAAAILELGKVSSEEDYLTLQLEILGQRNQIDLNECTLPEGSNESLPKRIIGKLRGVLWRLIRFGFEWTLFHQNAITEQQAITLAHEVRLRRRENDELRKRISVLEQRLNGTQDGGQS